jgi:hypothetical protein
MITYIILKGMDGKVSVLSEKREETYFKIESPAPAPWFGHDIIKIGEFRLIISRFFFCFKSNVLYDQSLPLCKRKLIIY